MPWLGRARRARSSVWPGVLIVLLKSKLLPVPEFELKKLRRSVIYFAVLNFVLGAGTMLIPSVIRIDQMAHLGGFLSGLAVGVPLVPRIGAPRAEFVRKQWIAFGGWRIVAGAPCVRDLQLRPSGVAK